MSKRAVRKSPELEFTVFLHRETERAALVSESGREERAFWLPKSRISITPKTENIVEISVPEWLAKNKGLI